MNIPEKIITHHALSSKESTAQDIDSWHKLRWPGFVSRYYKNIKGEPYHVGYHYVIEWNGNIIQCRDESEEGAHTLGMNLKSIGVCFVGNFDNHMPSKEQEMAWQKLYEGIVKRHSNLTPETCVPHRMYANKSCHGKLLSDNYFADLVSIQRLERRIVELKAILIKLLSLIKSK